MYEDIKELEGEIKEFRDNLKKYNSIFNDFKETKIKVSVLETDNDILKETVRELQSRQLKSNKDIKVLRIMTASSVALLLISLLLNFL